MECVVIAALCLSLGAAPGSVGTARQVAAIERIVGIELVACLEYLSNARIEYPAVATRSVELYGRFSIEIDGGDKGQPARRVHDDAVVVIPQFDAALVGLGGVP